MPELSDEFVLARFKHLFEQFFDSVEMRLDGEGRRYLHCEYSHPRYKRSWVPALFCGLTVHCAPSQKAAQAAGK